MANVPTFSGGRRTIQLGIVLPRASNCSERLPAPEGKWLLSDLPVCSAHRSKLKIAVEDLEYIERPDESPWRRLTASVTKEDITNIGLNRFGEVHQSNNLYVSNTPIAPAVFIERE